LSILLDEYFYKCRLKDKNGHESCDSGPFCILKSVFFKFTFYFYRLCAGIAWEFC
jgi:hypothetical protein